MNHTKWALPLALCLMFQPGISGQRPASQESVGDHLKRGDELASSRNLRGAIGEFRAAIRLDPSNANAHWGLAKVLDAQSDETFPLWSSGIMKDTLKEYQSALKLDPKLRDDKTESAERHFQRAEGSLGPDFGHWYSRWCGDFSDNWVNHCMDNAAVEFRIALLLDPGYVPAHVWLGVVLAKLHKTDAAIEEFRAALHLDPQSAEAHLGLGMCLEKKGSLKDALQEYGGALSSEEGRAKYEKLSAKLGIRNESAASPLPLTTTTEKPGQSSGPQSAGNAAGPRLRVKKDRKFGYLDNTGQLAIPLQYDSAGKFSEGLAPVTVGAKWRGDVLLGGKDGYIDTTGKLVLPAEYDIAREFSEGLAAVVIGGKWIGQLHAGGKCGYIDKTGTKVIRPQFSSCKLFSEGLAAVAVGGKWNGLSYSGGKCGYIDTTGKMVIPAQYEKGEKFSEGLAAVTVGKKSGYIDKTGQMIIPPQYDDAGPFSQGLAAVAFGRKWGFIDKTGKLVTAPQYDDVENPSEDL
jgi:tetratricopeptide (TPR) repeat protein